MKPIRVSEVFSSIQGEGNTSGRPSIFLRLTGCNLMCGGRGTEKDGELHDGATWRCDTIEVWMKGKEWEPQKLASSLAQSYADEFSKGAQLIITGGEPMLQQRQLIPFVKMLRQILSKPLRIEVETNGTKAIDLNFITHIDQFNCSPKLANSGMPADQRIKERILYQYATRAQMDRGIFKFVITSESDMQEVLTDFIKPLNIPLKYVYLMPGCSTKEQYDEVAPIVANAAMEHGFNFTSRLQINIWDQTTGV